jgi:hypothetical protein
MRSKKGFLAITLLGKEVLKEVSSDHMVKIRGAEKILLSPVVLNTGSPKVLHSLTHEYCTIFPCERRKVGKIVTKVN